MQAMILEQAHQPLRLVDVAVPQPAAGEVLVRVHACGLCRTDLHIIDGELDAPRLPLILGHQIVGTVVACGAAVTDLTLGQRVGIPWLGSTCQQCAYCRSGRENLCDHAEFTGYTRAGGLAEYTVADAHFCLPLPADYPDLQAAPLLCAGLIGYRALRLAGSPQRLGIYGFGAAAHIIAQVAVQRGYTLYAFTRPGDHAAQQFARELGAAWAGDSTVMPPEPLDAALIFAAVGSLVPLALRTVAKGGSVVCAGIHMSDIPALPYALLWGERVLRSVANLTRSDGLEFLNLAPKVPVRTHVTVFPLADANEALAALRGSVQGAVVVQIVAP